MNYAYVSGGDLAQDPKHPEAGAELHRDLYRRKPFTQLVSRPKLTTVKDFVGDLATQSLASVNDIYITCHGSPTGTLFIPLGPGSSGETSYEDVKAAISDPNKSIKISNSVLAAPSNTVHLRACSIGQWPKYLRKLKRAFGDQVSVSAPNYIHFVTRAKSVHASVEYLNYDFNVSLPALPPKPGQQEGAAVTDRAQIVQAFKNRQPGFTFYDGRPVPQSAWDDTAVIPRTIDNDLPPLKIDAIALKSPIGSLKTLNAVREFFFSANRLPVSGEFDDPKQIPNTPDAQKAWVKTALSGDKRFTQLDQNDPDPFLPMWERQGFTNIDDYINAFYWTFHTEDPTKTNPRYVFSGFGMRYIYSVHFPITEKPPNKPLWGGKLIVNAYPGSTPTDPAPSGQAVAPVTDLQNMQAPEFGLFTTV